MFRCIIGVVLVCIISHGHAQTVRNFPIDSQFGKLKSHVYPEFKIDKKNLVIGVGGQIRDKHNLLVMPSKLAHRDYKSGYVRYQTDNMGFLHRIWFLTDDEIQLAKEEEKRRKKQDSKKKFSIPFFQ